MSAPPTTRATRSRYSSPAVGGTGGPRGSNESSRARDKESRDAASLDRSRAFMEAWIEPERAKLASFQEDGLVRQGVLETMEPLGTRPKPAMVRKLLGASSPFHGSGASGGRDESSGQEGSPSTTTGPRKTGGKRIVLKRKNGGAAGDNSSNGLFDMSGTQSPTPSTAVATPHPSSTPAPEAAPDAGGEADAGAEAASTSAQAREVADSETEPEPEQDDQPEPALPLLVDNNTSPAPAASPAAATAKQRPSASIPPTSDIIQPESEDQPTSELTPTPLLHSESVLRSSPTPRRRRVSQSPPSPSHQSQSIPLSLSPLKQPALATRSLLFPPKHSARPLLPDPVKQSIEDLPSFSSSHQATSPRSVASFNDVGDTFFKRESSARSASTFDMAPRTRAQSAAPQQTTSPAAEASTIRASSAPASPAQPQLRDGPHYTQAELERIITQKEVVEKSFDAAVEEALGHHNYAVAYAFRTLYEEYEDNARFLLLAESIFRQTASADSVFNFGLYLNPRIAEGNKDKTAVKYFEPEARQNKEYVPHPPQAAPYRDHISLDLSRLHELGDNKKRKRDEDSSADETSDDNDLQPHEELQSPGKAEAEPDTAEVEPEAVATPPHPSKRQKLQNREPSTGRSAGRNKTAPASATRGMNGRANASPLRRKTRSGSVGSDSSLSTAKSLSPPLSPPQEADEDRPMHDIGDVPAAAAAAADADAASAADETGAPNPAGPGSGPGPEPQPIAARPRRAPARGRRNANASSSEPNANNAGQQDAASTNPVGDAPALGPQRSRNPRRGAPDFTPTQKLNEDDLAATRRRAARDNTHRLTTDARARDDSNARSEPMPGSLVRELSAQSDLSSVPDVEEPEPEPEPKPQAQQPTATTGRGARATRAAKRQHEDGDGDGDDAASTSPDFAPHGEPSTAVTSRAATPIRPAKRARTGPRLKVSPVKPKAGTAAGNPRARIDRASPTMNGNPNAQVDNDDFCSACGGNGEIVCCDGCARAFHQLCHDPFIPHSVLSDEDEEWYCWDCSIKRDPGLVKQHKGPWGPLLTALDKKHAVSYRLPKKTREYFEGVRTGPDGEYEDFIPQPKGTKKQKTVETKDFDFHQVVDKDNNPVLCHACRTGTRKDRPILPCSACGLWWHIDCLDPPRAITPNPNLFTCPCHVENLQKAVGPLGPAHKFRKIKGQSEIVYAFRRGNINNGYIEIEDDSEPAGHSGFRDQTFGHVYRLTSGGVQADFMQKVSRKATIYRPRKPVTLPRRIRDSLRCGSDRERMQAAVGLMRLAEAAELHAGAAGATHASQPRDDATTSADKMDATNQSLDTASIEELAALEEATRRQYDRIVSELKKRKEQEHQPSDAGDSASNVTEAPGTASTKTPRRSGRLTASATAEGQQNGGAADRNKPGVNDADTPKKSPAQSKVEPATTAANDSAPAPTANQKTAKDDDDSSVTQVVSNIIDAAVTSVVGADATSTTDIADMAANVEQKIDQDPAAQAAIDSALTPVSEANKDSEEQPPAVTTIKPTTSGVETPETEPNVPDQATSPADAMELD